ncbi:MAG TPA: RNA polymerase sigma factor [Sedimentisphaerales bacterium]|nr:RNA polymerase sigma factor [Sedimentisphaerales bacterium]
MLEDRLIIREFNRGNRQVLRQAYEKYKQDLMTLATALLYDKNAAEDVVQDVFVTLIKSAARFRLTHNLTGYLIACVVNGARNRNKAGQRHPTMGLDEAAPAVSTSDSPDSAAIFGEDSHRLAQALAQLPYNQREAVLLHVYSGMKFKVIAKLCGESVNTVKGRYRYGLDKLRSLLNSEVTK